MNLKSLALAAALTVSASACLADDQDKTISLASAGSGSFAAGFSVTHVESGLFVDSFVFSLPAAFANTTGNVSLSFASRSGDVSLVVATLDSANGNSAFSPPDADTIAIPSVLTLTGAMAPITLTVLGFAGDPFGDTTPLSTGYSGAIRFDTAITPIPEPQTYALMLAGLVGVAGAARRRRTKTEA